MKKFGIENDPKDGINTDIIMTTWLFRKNQQQVRAQREIENSQINGAAK